MTIPASCSKAQNPLEKEMVSNYNNKMSKLVNKLTNLDVEIGVEEKVFRFQVPAVSR